MAVFALSETSLSPTIRDNKVKNPDNLKTTFYQTDTSPQALKDFLYEEISKYGGNYALISDVINCESSWRTNVWSWTHSSYGVAQYTSTTFKENCIGSYNNPYDQIRCMVKMFNRGLSDRWDCFKILN